MSIFKKLKIVHFVYFIDSVYSSVTKPIQMWVPPNVSTHCLYMHKMHYSSKTLSDFSSQEKQKNIKFWSNDKINYTKDKQIRNPKLLKYLKKVRSNRALLAFLNFLFYIFFEFLFYLFFCLFYFFLFNQFWLEKSEK